MQRRKLLKSAAALALASLLAPPAAPARSTTSSRPRLLVLGGGWGGLAAARHLRALLPAAEITLIDREQFFFSRPLSSRWLVGLSDEARLRHDLAEVAKAGGYRFLAGEIRGIDRVARRVDTDAGSLHYDWLLASPGIAEDFSPWFGVDRDAADHCRQHHPSGFAEPAGLQRLKAMLQAFRGGNLVMNIPPMPYRCPPAPYERAVLIADWLQRQGLPGRITILDPNLPAIAFDRIFREAYRDRILYMPQASIRELDPGKKRIVTEFDTIDFDAAILMPAQRAASLPGLSADGASPWLGVDAQTLQWPGDERVFVIGDAIDRVSTLFGHYPKTGQIAARQGRIAARQIAARVEESSAAPELPDSTCIVIQRAEPLEMTRIDTHYRLRGDGEIMQTVKQQRLAQPADDDLAWALAMFAELGLKAPASP